MNLAQFIAMALTPQPPVAPSGPTFLLSLQSGSDTSISAAYPAGIVAGDLIVVIINPGFGDTLTPPAGYTSVGKYTTSGYIDSDFYVYSKVASGTESGTNLTATQSGFDSFGVWFVVVKGIGNTITTHVGTPETTSVFDHVISLDGSSISTSAANDTVVWFGVSYVNDATDTPTFTNPSTFTGAAQDTVFQVHCSYATTLCYKTFPSSTTGTYSGSCSYGSDNTRSFFTLELVVPT